MSDVPVVPHHSPPDEPEEEIFEFDDDDVPAADPELPKRLAKMCLRLVEYQAELGELLQRQKKLERCVRVYTERLLPGVMEEMGSRLYESQSGLRVELKPDVYMSFPKDPERRARAFAWLRAVGEAGLIRQQLTAEFGPRTDEVAEAVWSAMTRIAGESAELSREETVNHNSTLAFLRRRLESLGRDETPLEIFGADQRVVAKISLKR